MAMEVAQHAPRPIKRSPRYELPRNVFVTYSPTLKRAVKLFSLAHFHFWLLHESDPKVVSLCEYPDSGQITTAALRRGNQFEFTLWTRRADGVEVFWDLASEKAFEDDGVPLTRPYYWEAIEEWCARNGTVARFETHQALVDRGLYLDNWRQALPYVQHAQRAGHRRLEEEIVRSLEEGRPLPLSELSIRFPKVADMDLFAAVFHLLHQGKVTANFDDHPLNTHTRIGRAHERA